MAQNCIRGLINKRLETKMLMHTPDIRGGRRTAKHETSINKRTILTTCNEVRNENSKVNIRVKTFV